MIAIINERTGLNDFSIDNCLEYLKRQLNSIYTIKYLTKKDDTQTYDKDIIDKKIIDLLGSFDVVKSIISIKYNHNVITREMDIAIEILLNNEYILDKKNNPNYDSDKKVIKQTSEIKL